MQRKKIVVPTGNTSNKSYLPNIGAVDSKNPVVIWMSWAIVTLIILSIGFIYKYVDSQAVVSKDGKTKHDSIILLNKELAYIHKLKEDSKKSKHKEFELRYLGNAKSTNVDYTVLGLDYNKENVWKQSKVSGRQSFSSGSSQMRTGKVENLPLFIEICSTEKDSIISKKCTIMPFGNEDEWVFKIQ